MARVIDDPSLEKPPYAKGLRRPSQSTLQHVLPYSGVGLSLSFSLSKRGTPSSIVTDYTLSPGYNMYTASQVPAVFPSIISSIIVRNFAEDDLSATKIPFFGNFNIY